MKEDFGLNAAAPRPPSTVRMIDMPLQLRPGVFAVLRIPTDLTTADVKRIMRMLETVVVNPGAVRKATTEGSAL